MKIEDVKKVLEAIQPFIRIDHKRLLEEVVQRIQAISEDPGSRFADDLVKSLGAAGEDLLQDIPTLGSDMKLLAVIAFQAIDEGREGLSADAEVCEVKSITYKLSSKGNETYYLVMGEGKFKGQTLYLRSGHSEQKDFAEMYPIVADMTINTGTNQVSGLKVAVRREGRFLELEKIYDGGEIEYLEETVSERKERIEKEITSILSDNPVFVDFETTGIHQGSEIVSVAIVSSAGETMLDTYISVDDSKMLDVKKDGVSASDINGISPEDLEGKPRFPEVYEKMKGVMEGKKVIFWNEEFDTERLRQDLKRHSLEKFDFEPVCMMKLFAEWNGEMSGRGGYKYVKLSEAHKEITGSDIEHAHSAVGDAKATLAITQELADRNRNDIPF